MNDLDLDELDHAVNAMMDSRKRKKAAPASPRQDSVAVVRTGQTPMRAPIPRLSRPAPADPQPASKPDAPSDDTLNDKPAPKDAAPVAATLRPMPRVPQRKRTRPGAMDIIPPASSSLKAPPSASPARTAPALQPTKPVAPEPRPPIAHSAPALRPDSAVRPSAAALHQVPAAGAKMATDQDGDVSDELLASIALSDQPAHSHAVYRPAPAESKPQDADPGNKQPSSHDGWPDPLDFHDFGDHRNEKPAPDAPSPDNLASPAPGRQQAADETEESVAPTLQTPATAPEPAVSPFLPTKVEKRPLGAYAAAVQGRQQSGQTPQTPQWAQKPESADPPEPYKDEPAPQPAAASNDPLLTPDASKAAPASPQPLPDETPATTPDVPPANPHAQPNAADTSLDDLRQMTIPPQYQAAQHEPNDEIRNMFDVKEYHAAPQPMHRAKKGSPWVTAIIVVLLVLAVATALVAYFMISGISLRGVLTI